MKFQRYLKSALAVLAFSATSALATPITVQATGIAEHLTQGKHQGSFDATSVLPLGIFTIDYLQFSFAFVDDGDAIRYNRLRSTTSQPVTVRKTISPTVIEEKVTKTTTSWWEGTGEKESIALGFNGLSFTGETASVDASDTPSSVQTFTQTEYMNGTTVCSKTEWEKAGNTSCKKIIRTTTTNFDHYRSAIDYTGEVTFDGSLMGYSPALMSLMLTRKLDFTLDVLGDVDLLSATLDIGFKEPSLGTEMGTVPEPSSMILFGIALLGMAGACRKQRR
jgi:hypothetical protein